MNETQAEAVARIALAIEFDLPDTQKTTKNILAALNKAYQAGWSAGYEKSTRHNEILQEVVRSFHP